MSDREESTEEPRAEVWFVSEAADLRGMHGMLAFYRGDEVFLLETAEWKKERPVEHLLEVAGFTGSGGAPPARVAKLSVDDVNFVKLRGFKVAADKLAEVEMIARMVLSGSLGGFLPVLMGQTGFHVAAMMFEHVWNAAGRPPVMVQSPDMVLGRQGEGIPGQIHPHSTVAMRVLAALGQRGEGPDKVGS